jgi:hypothetical protein
MISYLFSYVMRLHQLRRLCLFYGITSLYQNDLFGWDFKGPNSQVEITEFSALTAGTPSKVNI